VFNNVKVAIGISGGGGSGVAVSKSGKRIYMKMGTAGIGLGLGGQKYQVVFFFETDTALNSFVDKGWKAEGSAQAAAGDKGANAGASFTNGLAVYQLTDEGLMASVDISGTKYWKNDDLNKK
jgi:lipid-binding SYLF domain-containing protein